MPQPTPPRPADGLDAAFLGPKAENADLLEALVVDALRDHVYWRRNFHPRDLPAIGAQARYEPGYQAFVARTEQVLRRLAADLKDSAPWFSPRYIGHMASDLLIPGVVGRFIGTLYNPNNISLDAGGRMLGIEVEVGAQLAQMVGYRTDPEATPRAWGHLTSGGTVANVEALWRMRAVRLIGPAIARGAAALGLHAALSQKAGLDLSDEWRVANLDIDGAFGLRQAAYALALGRGGAPLAVELDQAIEDARVENAGVAAFARAGALADPVVIAPHSAHYSWKKAMNLLGLGRAQLVTVDTDEHMRMDARHLEQVLERLLVERVPVIAAVGVLGTTEFGTFDPIDALVDARDARLLRGQAFGVHVDAAWGGYMTTLFRGPDGAMAPQSALRQEYRYFPSEAVYRAFDALARTDSITVDPHKLGFIPYAAGAFVARDRRVSALLTQTAPYVFVAGNGAVGTDEVRDDHLGKYVIEGSKPGATAASVYASHEVLPLHRDGFGALLSRTIRASEWLWDALRSRADELADVATLIVPLEPDSNIVCVAVNPVGNRSVEGMNTFMHRLFDRMLQDPAVPTQTLEFIGSSTTIAPGRLTPAHHAALLGRLGLEHDAQNDQGAIFLLRHTLMNPWLLTGDRTPLEAYLDFLFSSVRTLAR